MSRSGGAHPCEQVVPLTASWAISVVVLEGFAKAAPCDIYKRVGEFRHEKL